MGVYYVPAFCMVPVVVTVEASNKKEAKKKVEQEDFNEEDVEYPTNGMGSYKISGSLKDILPQLDS